MYDINNIVMQELYLHNLLIIFLKRNMDSGKKSIISWQLQASTLNNPLLSFLSWLNS